MLSYLLGYRHIVTLAYVRTIMRSRNQLADGP